MPVLPDAAFCTIAPDWICEVLSESTEVHDREEKMPVYAREGVRHAWLIAPVARTLEVFTLGAGGGFGEAVVFRGGEVVRAVPFDAIELALRSVDVGGGRRSEPSSGRTMMHRLVLEPERLGGHLLDRNGQARLASMRQCRAWNV